MVQMGRKMVCGWASGRHKCERGVCDFHMCTCEGGGVNVVRKWVCEWGACTYVKWRSVLSVTCIHRV